MMDKTYVKNLENSNQLRFDIHLIFNYFGRRKVLKVQFGTRQIFLGFCHKKRLCHFF
jgi:hypothetical protein